MTNNLKPLLLLGNGFLLPHQVVIDLPAYIVIFAAINSLIVPINMYAQGNKVIHKILNKKTMVISPGSIVRVEIIYAILPLGHNYTIDTYLVGVYNVLTDHGNFILIINGLNKP